jgi:tetratricopeptide (TPR) repeat protein
MISLEVLHSQDKVDSLFNVLKTENPNEQEQSLLYSQIAKIYVDIAPDSSWQYASKGLRLAEKSNSIEGTTNNSLILGHLSLKKDSLIKAQKYYLEVIRLTARSGNMNSAMTAWLMLGYANDLLSDYGKALEYNFKGLQIADSLGLKTYQSRFHNNIAVIYEKTGDYKKSIDNYFQAAWIFKEIGDDNYYANTLLNIGSLYVSLNLMDSAFKYLDQSKKINEGLKNHYGLLNYYATIGEMHFNEGDYNKALINNQHQLEELEKLDNSFFGSRAYLKTGVYINFGDINSEMGDTEKAIAYYEKALQLAKTSSFLKYITEAADGLSYVYEKTHVLDSALAYYKLFQKYNDSLKKEENSKKIAELELSYKLSEERKQMQLEKEQMESRQKIQGLIYLLIIGTSISALLLFILLYVRQKDKHRESRLKEQNLQLEKENLARELEYKNKELTTNVMYLLKKNEFISDISNKLKGANCKSELKEPKVISGIISELDKNSSNEVWSEFETRFQEIYGDFYKRLNEQFPDLTPNDLKLSAFLKLNMTTKEISAITYQSTETLKTARHRLRKKLGLNREDNLVAFLNQV